jgi:hypothetical protein
MTRRFEVHVPPGTRLSGRVLVMDDSTVAAKRGLATGD